MDWQATHGLTPEEGMRVRPVTFRSLRRERKLRLADIAKAVGVNQKTVWRWENGVASPSAVRLPALAATLGASVDQIVSMFAPDASPAPPTRAAR